MANFNEEKLLSEVTRNLSDVIKKRGGKVSVTEEGEQLMSLLSPQYLTKLSIIGLKNLLCSSDGNYEVEYSTKEDVFKVCMKTGSCSRSNPTQSMQEIIEAEKLDPGCKWQEISLVKIQSQWEQLNLRNTLKLRLRAIAVQKRVSTQTIEELNYRIATGVESMEDVLMQYKKDLIKIRLAALQADYENAKLRIEQTVTLIEESHKCVTNVPQEYLLLEKENSNALERSYNETKRKLDRYNGRSSSPVESFSDLLESDMNFVVKYPSTREWTRPEPSKQEQARLRQIKRNQQMNRGTSNPQISGAASSEQCVMGGVYIRNSTQQTTLIDRGPPEESDDDDDENDIAEQQPPLAASSTTFESSDPNCSICLDELVKRKCEKLECGHKFHKMCISNVENYKCPVCRKALMLTNYPDIL